MGLFGKRLARMGVNRSEEVRSQSMHTNSIKKFPKKKLQKKIKHFIISFASYDKQYMTFCFKFLSIMTMSVEIYCGAFDKYEWITKEKNHQV